MSHASHANDVRLLIVPGLHDSGPGHWQTWLQKQYRGAVRVRQSDWHTPDLLEWAAQVQEAISRAPAGTRWVAVAHSFGCLALVQHLAMRSPQASSAIQSALLVAPANPARFGLDTLLHRGGLGLAARVLGSENDPWMPLDVAQDWAQAWGAPCLNLGRVGHINVESGHGPWPWVRLKVDQLLRDQQRALRLQRAHPMELSYAV